MPAAGADDNVRRPLAASTDAPQSRMPIADNAPRPRSSTELVDAAAVLARHGYAPLLLVAAVQAAVELPFEISAAYALRDRAWVVVALLAIGRIAAAAVFIGAGAAAAAELYVGRRIEVDRVVVRAVARTWALARVAVVAYLATLCGTVALVFPGLIAIARFASAPAVIVIEGHHASNAIDRSFELSRGNERRIIGAIIPTALVVRLFAWSLGTAASYLHLPFVARTVVENVGAAAVMPIYYALLVAVYYDTRIRNEGFDVDLMMAALSDVPDAAPELEAPAAPLPAAAIQPPREPTVSAEG